MVSFHLAPILCCQPVTKNAFGKGSWGLVILISLVVVLEEEFLGTGRWQYDNAVARFPLYLLGMQCALSNKEDLPYKVTIPLFLLSVAFFFRDITTYFPHVLCSSPSK